MTMTWDIDPKEIIERLNKAAQSGVQEAAQRTITLAQQTGYVPVRTGRLRDSGVALTDSESPSSEPTAYAAFTEDYVAVVEFGQGTRPPNPYLSRAVGELEAEYEQIIADEFRKHFP